MPTQSELDALEISPAEIEQHRAEQAHVGGQLDAEGFHKQDGTRLGDPVLRAVDSLEGTEESRPGDQSDARVETGVVQRNLEQAVPDTELKPNNSVARATAEAAPPRTAPAQTSNPKNAEANPKPFGRQAIWAVQLASFASPVNATALRDRLLGDGFEAWTSTARRDVGVRTRVAIGPLLDRGDADRMRDLVSGRYNVSAIVVHMEP